MTLLQVRDLTVTFHQEKRSFDALKSVSLDVEPGEVVGLVGESGCGKTTLARAVLGLQAMTEGAVFFRGEDIAGHNKVQRAAYCRKVQMVFQDPFSSLNPRMTIGAILEEVLKVHTRQTREERRVGARELLEAVELDAAMLARYPHEFSGGQRQRIVIARALALQPEMLLADEPVSALDVSVQGRILDLLRKLHAERGLAMLFISHDLAVVQSICTRVYVMYLGRIVESGPVNDVFCAPAHPYTKALLSAVPRLPDDAHQGPRIILRGDVPTAIDAISGCAFHPRCPQVHADCSQNTPALENLPGERQVSCLHHLSCNSDDRD